MKGSEVCNSPIETSDRQSSKCPSHLFSPTSEVLYSSSNPCCKFRIKGIEHSVNICICIIVAPFPGFNTITHLLYYGFRSQSNISRTFTAEFTSLTSNKKYHLGCKRHKHFKQTLQDYCYITFTYLVSCLIVTSLQNYHR